MKSIKRGRGPSMRNGAGSIVAALFGVFWLILAVAITFDAPNEFPFMLVKIIFPLFGVGFIISAIAGAAYHFRNATGENRYSEFDIVEDDEEPDPLNEYFGAKSSAASSENEADSDTEFCPYCGAKAEKTFVYCRKCGKKLP